MITAKPEPYPSLSGWGNTNKAVAMTCDRQGCIHLTSGHGVMAMLSCCVCSKMLLLLIWWPHWSHWYHPYSVDRQTHTRLVMGFSWMVLLVIYTSSGVRGFYRGHHQYLPRGWDLHSRSFGTGFRWLVWEILFAERTRRLLAEQKSVKNRRIRIGSKK